MYISFAAFNNQENFSSGMRQNLIVTRRKLFLNFCKKLKLIAQKNFQNNLPVYNKKGIQHVHIKYQIIIYFTHYVRIPVVVGNLFNDAIIHAVINKWKINFILLMILLYYIIARGHTSEIQMSDMELVQVIAMTE